MTERRKGYLLGITPGEWLGAMIMVAGLVYGYGVMGETVRTNATKTESNERKIEKLHDTLSEEIKQSEERTRQEIKESEYRTREDIKELRQLLIKRQP